MSLRILVLTLFMSIPLCAAEPTMVSIAGTGKKGFAGDGGPAEKAMLADPFDVAFDSAGNLHFSDTSNHVARKVDRKTGVITTVAGTGKKGFAGDDGPATAALLDEPYGILFDRSDRLYIVDRLNTRIRRVEAGKISTFAGTGKKGFTGDGGPATKADLREPNGICLAESDDGTATLYIADVADQRVRAVDVKTGVISTALGTGKKEHSGDGGPIEKAGLSGPRAVAMGPNHTLYICEREGNCIRRVNLTTRQIDLFAGTMKKGFANGPALQASFNGPKELDVDSAGNVYVVDTENHAIRRIDTKTGNVTTIAGTGKLGDTGDGGPAVQATLGRPHGVVVGPDGGVYIGDTLSHRIRVVR